MTTNNDYFKQSLDMWQELTQAYADFAIETTRRALEQSLAMREQMDQVVAGAVKRSQELAAREQDIALEATEAFQGQVRSAAERVEKMMANGAAN